MDTLAGIVVGVIVWFVIFYVLGGFYTVNQNERAVKTIFGKAERLPGTTIEEPTGSALDEDERLRYNYPQVRIIQPGGPYFKFPWEKIYKVSIATQTVSIGYDTEDPSVNQNGNVLEAVTKDQLNTGLSGQIRFNVSESNLYAYLFAIKNPYSHVMGFFHSVLRERIARFESPISKDDPANDEIATIVHGISINDLRKNLQSLNEHMEQECTVSAARYGIALTATLVTGIDPPTEVESALAAINTAHNHVSSDISLAQSTADQKIVQSRRAVEIETLKAQAEVEPLRTLAAQLRDLHENGGPGALHTYLRNVRLALYGRARQILVEMKS